MSHLAPFFGGNQDYQFSYTFKSQCIIAFFSPSHCLHKRSFLHAHSSMPTLSLASPQRDVTACVHLLWCFPGGSAGKESACNAGDTADAGSARLERKLKLTPVFLPEKSRGQRSLMTYSPWGCKESDMTEGLSTPPVVSEPRP